MGTLCEILKIIRGKPLHIFCYGIADQNYLFLLYFFVDFLYLLPFSMPSSWFQRSSKITPVVGRKILIQPVLKSDSTESQMISLHKKGRSLVNNRISVPSGAVHSLHCSVIENTTQFFYFETCSYKEKRLVSMGFRRQWHYHLKNKLKR